MIIDFKRYWLLGIGLACLSLVSKSVVANNNLSALFADYIEQRLKLDPIAATLSGDPRYLNSLPFEGSNAHRNQVLSLEKEFLKRSKRISDSTLSDDEQLNLSIFKYYRQLMINSFDYPEHLIPLESIHRMTQILPYLGSGKGPQPFNRVSDYEQWYRRMEQLPEYVDQLIASLEQGAKEKVTLPVELVDKLILSLRSIQADLVENSIYYQPVIDMPLFFIPNQKQYIILRYSKLINQYINPSYQKLENYLKNHYRPIALQAGIGRLPVGNDWYRYLIKKHTSVAQTPKDIHQLGLDAIVKIHLQLEQVKRSLGFSGTHKELFEHMRTAERYRFENAQQLLDFYQALARDVNQKVPRLFKLFPTATYRVSLTKEATSASSGLSFFKTASLNDEEGALFLLNPKAIDRHYRWMSEALFLKYAVPGAMFQAGIESELDTIPEFRASQVEAAFIRGWSLYAMSLGNELGFYTEPAYQYGALIFQLDEFAKIVVDTGIHSLGWGSIRAESFLLNNTSMSESQVKTLVDFIVVNPAQSMAGGLGYFQINQLREKAQTKLKDKFNIKEFHQKLLKNGAVPFDVLQSEWFDKE